MRVKLLHSWLWVWSVAALLYGAPPGLASQPAADAKAATRSGPSPQAFAHIALLLPLNSAAFSSAAEAVRDGFLAAAKAQGKAPLPIQLYRLRDEPQAAVAAYRDALAAGARVAVGPLTRDAVTALAASNAVAIPTLALNTPDRPGALPADLFALSLHAESEARQIARLAAREGRANAVTMVAETPLLRRIHQAFIDEFTRAGGRHLAAYLFTPDLIELSRIRQEIGRSGADMAFLAVDFPRARVVRPHLGSLALYATSQVHPGNAGTLANFDLANVQFMDMPWLLQPDHPAVMIYRRHEGRASTELERLYALGIDAFRIAQSMLEGKREPLDGVTGRLVPGNDRHYRRELTRAQFSDGKLVILADPP